MGMWYSRLRVCRQLFTPLATAALVPFGYAFAQSPSDVLLGTLVGLTSSDRIAIGAQIPVEMKDGQLVDKVCGRPVQYQSWLEDLNGDSRKEVIIVVGNACANGTAGSEAMIFENVGAGSWRKVFGAAAGGIAVLPSKTMGWADIKPEAPGYCRAIWAWAGTAYVVSRTVAEIAGACHE